MSRKSVALKFALVAGIGLAIAAPMVFSQTTPNAPAQSAASSTSSSAADDTAADKPVMPGPDRLWQVTSMTTVAGQAPSSTTASLCLSNDELKTPPVAITGPQCESQTFSANGNTTSWTTDCDAVKGTGSVTLAPDGQSFAGDIAASAAGQDMSIHVDGVVTGTCTKT